VVTVPRQLSLTPHQEITIKQINNELISLALAILMQVCRADLFRSGSAKGFVCVRGGGHNNPALAPQPSMIYCASLLINPLLNLHFKWNVQLHLRGHHNSHLIP
jgi:hypothetical protein